MSDQIMPKYPKLYRLGHEQTDGVLDTHPSNLVCVEKLDGANFRFTYDEDRDELLFGSRNVVFEDGMMDERFVDAVEYTRSRVDELALQSYSDCVVYGESMHPHTLEYDWDSVPQVLVFDVYDQKHDEFVDYYSVEQFASEVCQMNVAPRVNVDLTESEPEIPDSHYRNGVAEGIVIRNERTGQRAKVRSQQFKEMMPSLSITTLEADNPSDATKLAYTFATEARVLKWIHKYEDRGQDIGPHVIDDLWRDVFQDIIDEEYETIFTNHYEFNTSQFRSEIASIVADIVEVYNDRPDNSVLNE